MNQPAKDCISFRTKRNVSRVKVEEHGKSAVFLNPDRRDVYVTKVDGGMVQHEMAADYVVSMPGTGDVVVELKGKEVKRAIRQILATAELLRDCGKTRGPLGALVVCTRVPSNDASASRLKNEFFQKYGARLHIKNGNVEHSIAELVGRR